MKFRILTCSVPHMVEGVRLNLLRFTWLVSCAIDTDHHSFQCSKAMPFWLFICTRVMRAYHNTGRAKGAVMQT